MLDITAQNVDTMLADWNAKIAKLKAKPFTKSQREAVYLVYLELAHNGDFDKLSTQSESYIADIINV
jgi:hypothetical protein